MLQLKKIVKEYLSGDNKVTALKGVDIEFRKNEFVSILGPSGCGKTTMLNIIGGLDKYTKGDLIINDVSTKKYKPRDWDSYRNHSIGFVFQSYNLIPHQNVLANVELALTLSGVSKKERRKRAIEALEKVGLGDQIHKKPNQMSGGQMQRVAIARALVNNPDILLADEPTGALDTATSVQIMQLLKEVAEDRLVIMVTHNPELAAEYSTRIIKLLDGKVIDDSQPYDSSKDPEEKAKKKAEKKAEKEMTKEEKKAAKAAEKAARPPRTSMKLSTALSLSFKNLLTKKGRTFLTAFAGSIGIIGISLILSISNGVQNYIDTVQEDTLSSYPVSIQQQSVDITSFMSTMQQKTEEKKEKEHGLDRIYTNQIMTGFMQVMLNEVSTNNLVDLKKYLDDHNDELKKLTTDIYYGYSTKMNIYSSELENGVKQIYPSQVFKNMGMGGGNRGGASAMGMTTEVWQRLINNDELLKNQYDVVAGKFPEKYNEVVLLVTDNNEITDYTLYSIGMLDDSELSDGIKKMIAGEDPDFHVAESYSYDDFLNRSFKLLINTDYYEKDGDKWVDKKDDDVYMLKKLADAEEIKIVGILKPSSNAAINNSLSGIIGYRTDLMEHLITRVNDSQIVKEQKDNADVDVFSGIKFVTDEAEEQELTMEGLMASLETLPEEQKTEYLTNIQQMKDYGMGDDKILEAFASAFKAETTDNTYEDNLKKMGVADLSSPTSINIYPKDFESKDAVTQMIADYNKTVDEENKITYTDYVGLLMSSVTTIINAISYILIAFVAISLVVSSIMIGIITYISVLERTKEIGILRAIGAAKKDISRVFNAETLIVGFIAGALGIGITLILLIPINAIIYSLTDIQGIAALPPVAGIILVAISMCLTLIAGILPSRVAAKKDPVVALRTE
ncbi:MAG: ABC transporter ATP-binding protein/permease [Lachnospiraceae bacterium]|nr:ABC transporter ATP-binding protein/permease [Lachnospiraceae bacterium]